MMLLDVDAHRRGERLILDFARVAHVRRLEARYAELQCASHFSFLRGASSCEQLFVQAEACEIEALAITDRNSLAGVASAHEAAKITGLRLIVGCRLDLTSGASLPALPVDRAGYRLRRRASSADRVRSARDADDPPPLPCSS